MAHQIEFNVTGSAKIHCASCEERIGRALKRVSGVADVTASAATQKIRVSVDPAKITPDQLRAKLEEIGYQAELAS